MTNQCFLFSQCFSSMRQNILGATCRIIYCSMGTVNQLSLIYIHKKKERDVDRENGAENQLGQKKTQAAELQMIMGTHALRTAGPQLASRPPGLTLHYMYVPKHGMHLLLHYHTLQLSKLATCSMMHRPCPVSHLAACLARMYAS